MALIFSFHNTQTGMNPPVFNSTGYDNFKAELERTAFSGDVFYATFGGTQFTVFAIDVRTDRFYILQAGVQPGTFATDFPAALNYEGLSGIDASLPVF